MARPKGVPLTEEHKRAISRAKRGKSQTAGARRKNSEGHRGLRRSEEAKRKTSESLVKTWGSRDRSQFQGCVILKSGHVLLTMQQGHPLVAKNGTLLEHRKALYDEIGEGPHECHWGCGKMLEWGGNTAESLYVDHLDGDPQNNSLENLVPSCRKCNFLRGQAGDPVDWSGSA